MGPSSGAASYPGEPAVKPRRQSLGRRTKQAWESRGEEASQDWGVGWERGVSTGESGAGGHSADLGSAWGPPGEGSGVAICVCTF